MSDRKMIWKIEERKYDDIITQLLFNRKIISSQTEEAIVDDFLDPDFSKDVHDPFLMSGIREACELIKRAKDNKEKVGIFSDYDADGIPGAALLYRGLIKAGIRCEVFIPNREGGYGLSEEGIDQLVNKGCSLIVTVDMGIRNLEEARYCKKKNIDLVITDHHLPGDQLPSPNILINPKVPGDKYPFKELCGCGIAFKLLSGLSYYIDEIDEAFLKWNLDLVCISTITDVVPLIGENRVLAKYGLKVMNKTHNLGLLELIKVSGINPKEIGAYHVGFQLGPRINAPGRMDLATKSFELLVTEDKAKASELASWLNEKNESRQQKMDEVIKFAIEKIDSKRLDQNKLLIVDGKWLKGVIGPSASKIVEKYHRPAIIFSADDTEYTGSARSVEGVNIVELFEKVSKYIKKFGGHKGAAGISVLKNKYDKFCQAITALANSSIADKLLQKSIKIDIVLKPPEISVGLYDKLRNMEPFGFGNSRPTFALFGVKLRDLRYVGKNKNHLSAKVVNESEEIKTIYFNFPYEQDMIKEDQFYDIAFTLDVDDWGGRRKPSLGIIDIRANDEKTR